jgi:hypothetical protein
LAPVLSLNVVTLIISAICVGGSFMLITMAGIKEALRIGGPQASRAVGMMSSAFAVGQIAAPLTIGLSAESTNAFTVTSIIAALALVLSNCGLLLVANQEQSI